MKKVIVISAGFFLLPLFLFAQKDGNIGIVFQKGNSNWGKDYHFVTWIDPNISENYIGSNYLKFADIITHVDGTEVRNMDEDNLINLCKGEVGSQVELTVLRVGSVEPIKIRIKREVPLNALWGPYYFATKIDFLAKRKDNSSGSSDRFGWFVRLTNENVCFHQIMRDREIDFLKYKTFDFEYINQNQPLLEKELTVILGDVLEEKGLVRDKENPDILVFIDFFADKNEYYVPPTTQIHTRYKRTYDWWTSQYENRQYVESTTSGDYIKTTHLTLLKVAFMDANKAKDVDSKVPPIIWEATYEFTWDKKAVLLDEAKREYPLLLSSYPVISWQLSLAHYDWGIYVDKDNPNKIAKVIPNSFAEKVGLQENDVITMVRKVGTNILIGENYTDDPMFDLHALDRPIGYISKITVKRNGKNKSFSFRNPQPSITRIVMSKPLK